MNLLLKGTVLKREDTKVIWVIMLPALFELIMSHLFSMVDTVMLGHSAVSTIGIAAVGLSSSPFNLCNGVISALNIGTTAAVAWAIGAGNREDAKSITRTALSFSALVGVAVSAALFIYARPIVILVGAQEDTLEYAVEYLQIVAVGMLPLSMTYAITGSLRGIGETKLPMLYNLVANFINVIGNYMLIYGKFGFPELGVAGAGISTTISRYIAFVLSAGVLFFGNHAIRQRILASYRMRLKWLKRIANVGGTAALEQLIMQVGFFLFARTVSGLGTDIFAAHQIALNVNGLTWMPAQAFGVASTTLVGQSLGAGRKDKADGYIRFIHRFSLLFSFAFAVLFLALIRQITLIYTNDAEVAAIAASALTLIALGMPGIFTQLPVAAGLRGAGDTKFPLIASAVGIWVFRVALSNLFIYKLGLGLNGAWLLIVMDQYTRAVVVYARYRSGRWAKKWA